MKKKNKNILKNKDLIKTKIKPKNKEIKPKKETIILSKDRKKFLQKIRTKKIVVIISQIMLLALFLGLWEILTYYRILDPFFFSSPSRMYKNFFYLLEHNNLMYHIGVTLYEAILGFVIATGLGFVIAIILWWSDYIRRVLDPYLVVLNCLPKISLAPIIIIWFGAETKAIVVMAILIIVIITILSLLSAFMSCEKNKITLLKSMNASKFQIFFKLVFPNALPDIISVLKINIGLTWIGTIMGELIVTKAGLGYLLENGKIFLNLDTVMTSTVVLCVLAGGMYAILAIIEKIFKKHRR